MDTLSGNCSIRWRSLAAIAMGALALAGCGGSGGGGSSVTANTSSSACTRSTCGTLMVGVTDADGDFINYSVDVLSISLKRQNGTTVEMLPQTTRVDFAQLTDLTDLLAATTLAPGDFVGGTIRVDYSNAEVFVEVAGQSVKAKVIDANGQPLGVTDLNVQLSNRKHLVLTPARVSFLTLDFDLADQKGNVLAEADRRITARNIRDIQKAGLTEMVVPRSFIVGRTLARDVINRATGEVLAEANALVTDDLLIKAPPA